MKELTPAQLSDCYRHFTTLGWKVKRGRREQKRQKSGYIKIAASSPAAKQQRKVLAIWKELGYPMDAIHSRVKTQFGVDRFQWLLDYDSLHILITDLQKRLENQKRRGRR